MYDLYEIEAYGWEEYEGTYHTAAEAEEAAKALGFDFYRIEEQAKPCSPNCACCIPF